MIRCCTEFMQAVWHGSSPVGGWVGWGGGVVVRRTAVTGMQAAPVYAHALQVCGARPQCDGVKGGSPGASAYQPVGAACCCAAQYTGLRPRAAINILHEGELMRRKKEKSPRAVTAECCWA